MRFNHITVPTDFSDNARNAAEFAIWLADNHVSRINIVHVILPGTGELDVPVISAGETVNRIRTAEEVLEIFKDTVLRELEEKYKCRNQLAIDLEIRVGAPAVELMTSVRENDSDLIIMGTRGKHNRMDELFGSVTTATLSKSPIPVFVVPENATHIGFREIVFASDLDPDDAMAIWETGQLLAPFNPIVRVMHVEQNTKGEGKTMHIFKEFLSGRPMSLQLTFDSVEGDNVGEAIADYAADHEVDLVAVHSPKRNWFERLAHRSISRDLALHSSIPLLVMR